MGRSGTALEGLENPLSNALTPSACIGRPCGFRPQDRLSAPDQLFPASLRPMDFNDTPVRASAH